VQHAAERAVVDEPADLAQCGLVAPVVADAERHAGIGARARRSFGACGVEPERLLAEDVLACFRSRDDLLRVHRVRRGQHHRVYLGVGQRGFVAGKHSHAAARGELTRFFRRARRRRGELQVGAVGRHAAHQVLAPGAQPDDGGADHGGTACWRLLPRRQYSAERGSTLTRCVRFRIRAQCRLDLALGRLELRYTTTRINLDALKT
jgi:hypothetical protein